MKIIGLMGGSGAGKSTIAAALSENGCFIIDCDKIAHEVIMPGRKAYKEIVSHFGEGILFPDKSINRRALGEIVFSEPEKLKRLEEITHFYIKQEIFELLKSAEESGVKTAVIDAPLLTEAGLDKECDEVWLVYAEPEVRLKRLMKRDGLSAEQLNKRLKIQTEFEKLKGMSDVIIDTGNMDIKDMFEFVKEKI